MHLFCSGVFTCVSLGVEEIVCRVSFGYNLALLFKEEKRKDLTGSGMQAKGAEQP